MGKGAGCVPSKKKPPRATNSDAPQPHAPPSTDRENQTSQELTTTTTTAAAVASRKLKIFIVFYSMYGHVKALARRMKKGVDGVEGVEGVLYRVPETLSDDVLAQMRVPPKDDDDDDDVHVLCVDDIVNADGFLFGFPTRYGCMAAQMKAFFDSTASGGIWKEQKLAGKPAGFFVSTGTQGGGQETTAWTAITQLVHHGMLYVPVGYTFGAGMFKMDSIRGGSPYGAGVFAGDGTREPTETELALAEHQGKYMAAVVKRLTQA